MRQKMSLHLQICTIKWSYLSRLCKYVHLKTYIKVQQDFEVSFEVLSKLC